MAAQYLLLDGDVYKLVNDQEASKALNLLGDNRSGFGYINVEDPDGQQIMLNVRPANVASWAIYRSERGTPRITYI